MKFLADMGISIKTVSWLREQGYDAVHLRERDQQRLPDSNILFEASEEGRILLTMDLDFGYLLAIAKAKLPSVIIFRLEDERAMNVNKRLHEVLAISASALITGAVISVTEDKFRVRFLPISKK